jgi:hypothetical protein
MPNERVLTDELTKLLPHLVKPRRIPHIPATNPVSLLIRSGTGTLGRTSACQRSMTRRSLNFTAPI